LAREVEARGFDSLFVCEHTHIPISRRTPFPGGGELPERYSLGVSRVAYAFLVYMLSPLSRRSGWADDFAR
jgi:hypothetical protein